MIHAHIDAMDELEAGLESDIDGIMKSLDIDEILHDPELVLTSIVHTIKEVLIEDYIPKATELGFKIADRLEKLDDQGKDVVIQDTNNPNINDDKG